VLGNQQPKAGGTTDATAFVPNMQVMDPARSGRALFSFYIGKEINMMPQTNMDEQKTVEEASLPEEYVRQVEDHSRPAQEVLTDQHEGRTPDDAPVVFVP
jgi:hypothetical protein